MKKLEIIQKIMQICSILNKIAYWACLVAACLCVLSILILSMGQCFHILSDEMAFGITGQKEGIYSTAYAAVSIGLVNTLFSFLIARKWVKYYDWEIKDGTPFSEETGKYLFDVAKYSLIMGFVAFIISAVIDGVFLSGAKGGYDVKFSLDLSSVLFAAFLSLVFRYGAEVKEGK